MMDWLDWDDITEDVDKEKENHTKNSCNHEWEYTGQGINSRDIWYNCKKCGIKKEDYERNR